MSNESDESRRGGSRKPIELKVEYKRLNAFFADYTRNISNGGTFIQTEKPLPIGTEFVFKLQVPRLEEPLSIEGQVRWINKAGSEEDAPGMGIRFIYKQDSQRRLIEDLVEGLMVDSLGRLLTTRLLAFGKEVWEEEEASEADGTTGTEES
ncbi:MAG: TIGR02266 family protein [Myxococcales bacterium]|nr:TIGR02266 family protein [Myxococcales bacterium]